jgi:cullin-associated NEDD8-dissociated protein 1
MSDEEDDETWKVRRSAIRTLTSVVEAEKHDPSKLWTHQYAWRKNSDKKMTLAGALVNRFKERDENCRVDNIECFTRLLSYTVTAASSGVLVLASPNSMSDNAVSTTTVDLSSKVSSAIVKACEKQLSAKKAGERSKSSAIALLSTLCQSPGGIGGTDEITSVFKHVKTILSSSDDTVTRRGVLTSSKALKLESLRLVKVMLSCKNHDAEHMKSALITNLLPELCSKYDWYKVIAEALRVLEEVPQLIILGNATDAEQKSVANSLFVAIEPRLAEHDLDQEIKECALSASASLISVLHASLTDDQKNNIFDLLLERLKNDTTRVAAIKTLSVIAEAAQKDSALDLKPIMNASLLQLSGMLRQSHRGLKQNSLECLDRLGLCLGEENGTDMDDGLFDSVLEDLGKMISPADLHLCSLGCSASTSILKARPSTGSLIESQILPAALELSNSPHLQEKALVSLLSLFEQMILSKAISFDLLYSSLTKDMIESTSKSGKQVTSNLAECIATIAVASAPSKQKSFVQKTIKEIDLSSENVQLTQLYLLVTGNIGRKVSLDSMGVTAKLKTLYDQAFDSSSEDIKHAAALALGRASVGSMDAFLPGILTALEESTGKKQYLLLSSLREFIHCYREAQAEGSDLSSSIPLILPHLEKNCENEAEGVRTMVAECLGSLACIQPAAVLPLLLKLATNEGEHKVLIKWTVGNAVKFAIGGRVK